MPRDEARRFRAKSVIAPDCELLLTDAAGLFRTIFDIVTPARDSKLEKHMVAPRMNTAWAKMRTNGDTYCLFVLGL